MWSNNTRDKKIKGEGHNRSFNIILNGYENIDNNNTFFFKIKAFKRIRGHNFMMVKEGSMAILCVILLHIYSRVYTQILTRVRPGSDPGQASTLGAIAELKGELKNNPGYI